MKIEVTNYTKKIKNNTVLDNVTSTFESGKIYGLHGRNGSGKTMLLRAISGLILPTSGYVSINGKIVGKDIEFPENIGIIIEHMSLMNEYSAFDNLKMLAKIRNKISETEIRKALVRVGLDPESKKKVKTFSLGMKQKLNIAQAIMEEPEILLLDEPTNALDEETVKSVRDLLLELKENGTVIIIASHNKEDLDILCDHILEIENGGLKNG